MILLGASGAQAEITFSLTVAGSPVTGKVWSTGELKLRLPGGTYANATVANIVEYGLGKYAVQLTSSETANPGVAAIEVNVAGAHETGQAWTETISVLGQKIDIIAGLLHQNSRLDNITYNGAGLMTAARLRVFASAAACNAATAGAADNADSETYRFLIAGVDDGSGKLGNYKLTRVL